MATDEDGNAIHFFNTEFSGHGCAGKYTKTRKPYIPGLCYVRGLKYKAEEASFGGIVVYTYKEKTKCA